MATSFLDLPAEIRFEIYHIINGSNDSPMSSFKGLYLSCKQTKGEMDIECTQQIRRSITKAWANRSSALNFEATKTFSTTRTIKITKLAERRAFRKTIVDTEYVIIDHLASLPLGTITISLKHREAPGSRARRRMNLLFYRFVAGLWNSLQTMQDPLRTQKIVFEDTSDMQTGMPYNTILKSQPQFERIDEMDGWGMVIECEKMKGGDVSMKTTRLTQVRWANVVSGRRIVRSKKSEAE